MSKELIDKLSKLKLEETSLKRILDTKSFASKGKPRIFQRLQEVKKEIDLVKFKLRMEKELNNEKRNWRLCY